MPPSLKMAQCQLRARKAKRRRTCRFVFRGPIARESRCRLKPLWTRSGDPGIEDLESCRRRAPPCRRESRARVCQASRRGREFRRMGRRKAQGVSERHVEQLGRNCEPRSPCRGKRRPTCRRRRHAASVADENGFALELERRLRAANRRHGVGHQDWASRAAKASRNIAGATCKPSTIRPYQACSDSSAAAIGPGSRLSSGRMALKRCVKQVRPAAIACLVCAYWPSNDQARCARPRW